MTVSDLIEELQKLPGDLPLVMSQDSEGNEYRTMRKGAIAPVLYRPAHNAGWYGEVASRVGDLAYFEDLDANVAIDLEDKRYSGRDDIPIEKANAIAIWPVN